MTPELLLLFVGAALILAGVLAAGALRAIELSQVGRTPRIAVAAAGLLCVLAALILMGSDRSGAPTGPVRVTIINELGSDQVSEEIRVFIDGRDIGVVSVDEEAPRARLTVTVAKAGRHEYSLASTRQLKGQEPREVISTGDVEIDGKAVLAVYANGRNTYLLPEE